MCVCAGFQENGAPAQREVEEEELLEASEASELDTRDHTVDTKIPFSRQISCKNIRHSRETFAKMLRFCSGERNGKSTL